jgi:integrase
MRVYGPGRSRLDIRQAGWGNEWGNIGAWHTAATLLYRRGVPKEAIRRMLGHHSWEFTASAYLHLDDDDLPDGAVLGDLVASGKEVVQERERRTA